MSIETIQITTDTDTVESKTPAETIKVTADAPAEPEESIEDRRVRLHDELAAITIQLHELQMRHTKLNLGLIALAEQLKASPNEVDPSTHAEMTEEYWGMNTVLAKLRAEQRTAIMDTTACNQTITRPLDTGTNEDRAERKRIEQPYIIKIYNNGEDPTKLAGVPEHLVGDKYRYLTNAPI